MRPVCLYTNRKDRFYGEDVFPALRTDVVPFREDKIESAADICEILDLSWNEPGVLRRFRDKYAMKSYIARNAPEIRVPLHWKVQSSEDLVETSLPDRFVVKPNDGLANTDVGIFNRDELDLARKHIDDHAQEAWVIEEFITGIEYAVNGHVGPDGHIDVVAVMEYVRGEVNGYQTVYLNEMQLRTNEGPFAELVQYATALITALDLRSCPFHLEAKVDADGPCVIDLGARLPSECSGHFMTRMHPYRPNMYLVAAHDYLGRSDLGRLPLRWDHYNQTRAMLIYGICEEATRIRTLHGVEDVEALPEFVRWPMKPAVGTRLETTTDLFSTPWVVEVEGDMSREEAFAFADKVRSMITWNATASVSTQGKAVMAEVVPRGSRRGRWLVERTMRSLGRKPR